MADDIFDGLLVASWRGIEFPYTAIPLSFQHAVAMHMPIDRDGAYPEALGRGPRQIQIEIPFINGLRGFEGVDIYPGRFRAFEQAFEDKSQGTLVHPERGAMQCIPGQFTAVLDTQRRNGKIVSASWTETNEQPLEDDLVAAPRKASMRTAAQALDAVVATLPSSQQPNLPREGFASFDDFAAKLSGAQRNADFQRDLATRKADRIIQIARAVKASASSTPAALDVVDRFTAAARETKAAVVALLKPTRFTRIEKPMSLAGAAYTVRNTPDQILALNERLRGQGFIDAGTLIKHYIR
jgi:hypothetical protein